MCNIINLSVTASLIALTACASIVEGSTDHINIATSPPSASSCQMSNSRGTVSAFTPSNVAVKKSKSDLNITCSDPRTGATGSGKLVSEVEPWDFGNILIGGLIGMSVDWSTGAAYNYPDNATVTLNTPVAYSAPTPTVTTPFSTGYAPATAQPVAPTPYAPTYQPAPQQYYRPPITPPIVQPQPGYQPAY